MIMSPPTCVICEVSYEISMSESCRMPHGIAGCHRSTRGPTSRVRKLPI